MTIKWKRNKQQRLVHTWVQEQFTTFVVLPVLCFTDEGKEWCKHWRCLFSSLLLGLHSPQLGDAVSCINEIGTVESSACRRRKILIGANLSGTLASFCFFNIKVTHASIMWACIHDDLVDVDKSFKWPTWRGDGAQMQINQCNDPPFHRGQPSCTYLA